MEITGKIFKEARQRAGHTQAKCAVLLDISHNLVVNLEVREELPKSENIKRAMKDYVKKWSEK